MTEAEIARLLTELPGVAAITAGPDNGAPEVAWGDSFFYYDPEDDADNRQLPFATIVTSNYPGFDTASDLDRPGVFRLNLAVGRDRFTEVFGFPPAAFAEHPGEFDFAALDRVLPHPVYSTQGWLSVLCPGIASGEQTRELIGYAHDRAVKRHRPRI